MKLKNKLEIGVSLLVGGSTIYASEKLGITDLMVDYEIWKASFFGEWTKNFAEDYSSIIRIANDFSIGISTGGLAYIFTNVLRK